MTIGKTTVSGFKSSRYLPLLTRAHMLLAFANPKFELFSIIETLGYLFLISPTQSSIELLSTKIISKETLPVF